MFESKTHLEQTDSLAKFLPDGALFYGKFIDETNIRRMLKGLAWSIYRAEEMINTFIREHDVNTTTLLIDEWENALGIPDSCFKKKDISLEQRRRQVITKLAAISVVTREDFINLGKKFLPPNTYIDIEPGRVHANIFPMTFPIKFYPVTWEATFPFSLPVTFQNVPKEARFTMIVKFKKSERYGNFPYTFPIIFGTFDPSVLLCLFSKLVPANVNVVVEYID